MRKLEVPSVRDYAITRAICCRLNATSSSVTKQPSQKRCRISQTAVSASVNELRNTTPQFADIEENPRSAPKAGPARLCPPGPCSLHGRVVSPSQKRWLISTNTRSLPCQLYNNITINSETSAVLLWNRCFSDISYYSDTFIPTIVTFKIKTMLNNFMVPVFRIIY